MRHDVQETPAARPESRIGRTLGLRAVLLLALLACASSCSNSEPPVAEEVSRAERERLDREFRELVDGFNATTGARQIRADELRARTAAGEKFVFLDIREVEEFTVSSLPGADHLPPNKVPEAAVILTDIPPGATLVTYCTAGYRSGLAAIELENSLGREVFNLDGGIIEWFNIGGDVVDPKGRTVHRIHPFGPEWARYVHPRTTEE
jgi:rhodanese-related sulfurtransferase